MQKRVTVGWLAAVAALVGLPATAGADAAPVSFLPKVDVAVGAGPRSIAVGDLNGDGNVDVVTANLGIDGTTSSETVLLGDGSGGLTPGPAVATGTPIAVALGDLDDDGHLDLVTANGGDFTVSVALGDGAGGFGARTTFPSGPATDLDLADLNGDGRLDVATANTGTNTVSVLVGDGAGHLGAAIDTAVGVCPNALVAGRMNADAVIDLVVVNGCSDTISLLLGNGTGSFPTRTDLSAGDNPQDVAAADVNHDGALDVAVASYNTRQALVFLGDGAGHLAAGVGYTVGSGLGPSALAVADLNLDGDPDIAVAAEQDDAMSVVVGDGTGAFAARTDFPVGNFVSAVAVADLDGDGRPDVMTTSLTDNTLSVLINASGTPSEPFAPTIIRNATGGNGKATVSWAAPGWNGGSPLTGYIVTPYIGFFPLTPQGFPPTATTQTITGLENGATYRFRVQATNAIGTSAYSKVTNPVTPAATVPAAPTIVKELTVGDASATISWIAPTTDGGSPLTGYVVTPYIGYFPLSPRVFPPTATTQTITGLENGTTYRFRVQATNAVGTSGYSKVTNPATPAP